MKAFSKGDGDGQELRERQDVPGEAVRRQAGAGGRRSHGHPDPQGGIRGTDDRGQHRDRDLQIAKESRVGNLENFSLRDFFFDHDE